MKHIKSKKLLVTIIIVSVVIMLIIGYFIGIKIQKDMYPIKYNEYVVKYSEEYNVPQDLIYAVIRTESSFDEKANSSAGAVGLMQIMPDTFDWISKHMDESYAEGAIYQPESNIKCGTFYLSYLYEKFGNWDTALAGYNAGHGRVAEWLSDTRYTDDGITLKNIPYTETNNYVIKVNKAKEMYINLYFDDSSN